MTVGLDDLVDRFWKRAPERVAEATGLWLAVERGEIDRLPELRRLLHTIKGEAQMLGLEEPARILQLSEHLVDVMTRAGRQPVNAGDALLGGFEGIGLFAANIGSPEALDLQGVVDELQAAITELEESGKGPADSKAAASASAPPKKGQEQGAPSTKTEDSADRPEAEGGGSAAAQGQAATTTPLDLENVQRLFHGLRRLQGEQTVLLPELSEIQRQLRALLAEIDPNVDAELLRERVVKTLGYSSEIERRMTSLRAAWSSNEFSTNLALDQLEEVLQRASLVSTSDLQAHIHRVARGTAKAVGKEVNVIVEGDAMLDAAVERRLRPSLLHLVRNAVDHGIESEELRKQRGKPRRGTVKVTVRQSESSVRVVVEDDGGGIDFDAIRKAMAERDPRAEEMSRTNLLEAIFQHGVSTRTEATDISGRGVGLDVVATELAAIGGTTQIDSRPGEGTRFVLTMPATLKADVVVPLVARTLACAVPARSVVQVTRARTVEKTSEGLRLRIEGSDSNNLVPLSSLSALVHGNGQPHRGDVAVVVQHRTGLFAMTVDGFQNPRPVTFQRSEDLAFRSPLVRGVALQADGGALMLLDVDQLWAAASRARLGLSGDDDGSGGSAEAHVLVVEDAPVARELLVGVLRSFGLRVTEAVDGRDGLSHALRDPPNMILTDIEMPYLGGLEMIARIRQDARMARLPIVVLTTRVDEETRSRARDLGVRSFLSKQKFVEERLREVVEDCLGKRQ